MKLPWFSSGKSSKKILDNSKKKKNVEQKKTYKLSSLPENLQKIAFLIQHSEKEIRYLQKKLDVSLTAKKQLEQQLSKELKLIKD
tara:strand:+ start:2382 stop:2636 length:255 start_codon:yes stop_codon:yes gene_type:complete